MVLKAEVGVEEEKLFREVAMKKYGYQKGSLQKAIKEAIYQWRNTQEDTPHEKASQELKRKT